VLPDADPDSIDLTSRLGIGHSLHVSDIARRGVDILDEPSTTIVSLVAPTAEVAPKTAEEVEAELAKSFCREGRGDQGGVSPLWDLFNCGGSKKPREIRLQGTAFLLLIVGLGNPGPAYETTRHNVGSMLVDRLSDRCSIKFTRSPSALWGRGRVFGHDAVLLKPQTFMNLSGEAVAEFKAAFSVDTGSIIAAYDDWISPGGGSG
jgi:hypothetical protein